jgi:hypothetical protein
MFGRFGNATITDPVLGELKHARGRWRGAIDLAGARIALALSGDRKAPDERAIDRARNLPVSFAACRPQIESALFEHHAPCAEAIASGELPPPPEGAVDIKSPVDVWRYVVPRFVSIEPMRGTLVAELAFAVSWDEEHTLGARFDQGRFIELCGSVIPS